jgi:DNA-binding transcriptional regulator YhcF (GntR family)
MEYITKFIIIDDFSATPKYIQLVNSIIKAINEGKIQKNDVLPSINVLSNEFQISRDTVEKGYKHLKKIGILGSITGKGYFVRRSDINQPYKVLLLFNKLSAHKKIIYDAFVEELGELASIDFYIYNNDFNFFKKILKDKIHDDYSHYVIIPHFIEGGEYAHQVLDMIEREKLILLDKKIPGIKGRFGIVYENFELDIYNALEKAIQYLQKYQTIRIIFPENSYYPQEILKGLFSFCQDFAFNCEVLYNNAYSANTGDVFICVMEDDLVELIGKIKEQKLEIGKDTGIISYNETPLKKVILNGITTISTNFREMGRMAAKLILNNTTEHIQVPFDLTLRNSL